MNNLILPFVVVALFAVGSCGDEAVQPSVVNPKDTTIGKDTIDTFPKKAIQIDSLKEFTILGLTSEQRYYYYYRDINIDISEKTDTLIKKFDQIYRYHPALPNKPVSAYFNPSYHTLEFSFIVYNSDYGNAKLSCKLDTNSGIITDFIYQYNSLSAGSNSPKGSYERKSGLYLHINKIPYTISKDTLTCQIEGTQLQKAIIDFDHSSSFRSDYPSSHEYYEYKYIRLMPFATDALVRFKFIIKK